MKKILSTALTLMLIASPALAGTRRITAHQAKEGTAPIQIWIEGGGLNIDLSQLNETITQIFLDDASQIGYFHCLLNNSCNGRVPPIIHLKRINKINFPNVPSTTKTLLTVVTVDRRGQWNSYQFPISLGAGSAQYNRVSVQPGGGGNLARSVDTSQLQAGIQAARDQGLIRSPEFNRRLNSVVSSVGSGESVPDAAARNGVSVAVVRKLVATTPTHPLALQPIPVVTEPVKLPPPPIKIEESFNFTEQDTFLGETPEPLPQAPSKPVAKVLPQTDTPTHIRYANALVRGLTAERNDGAIQYNDRPWRKVNSAVRTLRKGGSLPTAAQRSGVSIERLTELIERGGLQI